MASQTITGDALQFTQDNKHCFAFSGEVTVGTGATTLLSFQTGGYYVRARFQFAFSESSTADVSPEIDLDGITVFKFYASQQALTEPYSLPYVDLIIPPETVVLCTSTVSGGSQKQTLNLVGRVYEYLPVRN